MTKPAERRAEISKKLWEVAQQHIAAEWICCDPVNLNHTLCVQGNATMIMVKALLVDSPDAWNPAAPLLDAIMGLLPELAEEDEVVKLDQPVEAISGEPAEAACAGVYQHVHTPHEWQPQTGMSTVVCPGKPRDEETP